MLSTEHPESLRSTMGLNLSWYALLWIGVLYYLVGPNAVSAYRNTILILHRWTWGVFFTLCIPLFLLSNRVCRSPPPTSIVHSGVLPPGKHVLPKTLFLYRVGRNRDRSAVFRPAIFHLGIGPC